VKPLLLPTTDVFWDLMPRTLIDIHTDVSESCFTSFFMVAD